MVQFKATILKFDKQGEKTGWSYISIPAVIAEKIKPGVKISFRVKGMLDDYAIHGVQLLPMGGGDFILPINAVMRKALRKTKGAVLQVKMEWDDKEYTLPAAFMECLEDEPEALAYFKRQTRAVQNYFGKWIESAKTEATKTKRIAIAVNALARHQTYQQMLRSQREIS